MDFWEIARQYGPFVACLWFAVMALYFDWVVPGKRHREVCRQRDRLLRLALGGQKKAGLALDLANALVPLPAPGGVEDDADAF